MDYQTDDIQILIQNPELRSISVGLFDTLEDKRPIKVGSIIIGSTQQAFLHSNSLLLGGKRYLLQHYATTDNNNAVIYNFKPGVYLSELENVILDPKTDENKFILLAASSVWVTISTVK